MKSTNQEHKTKKFTLVSKKQVLTLFVVVLSALNLNAQTIVSGVKVDDKLSLEGKDLTLNGAGIREKLWMDLYVGSLYVTKKTTSGQEIVDSKDAVAIKLNITSGMITSSKMINAVNEGFEKSTNKNTAPLKTKIDKFKSFFNDKINKGDVFVIMYNGNESVVYKNGTKKGSVEGYEFKKAVIGIWLGKTVVDEDLKAGMLGK
ncbi:chalcone isomerase family protein [uncultured Flavobacterium sp.]|uniref:chalcone isomerase family protein n=1 Tax=uncultured Flavobacterium sp. TaxID=165435 RepID=UPI0030CA1FBA